MVMSDCENFIPTVIRACMTLRIPIFSRKCDIVKQNICLIDDQSNKPKCFAVVI